MERPDLDLAIFEDMEYKDAMSYLRWKYGIDFAKEVEKIYQERKDEL